MSMIQVTNLAFSYEGSYDLVFDNVSFQIDSRWKLGFIGRNGRGKTTFLNLLLGKYEYQGSITHNVEFEYFPYEVGDKSRLTSEIADEILPVYEYWQLLKELNILGLEEEILYRPFETLSNGEQTKVLLALLFLKESSFLLIDEPTNHLDIEARELIAGYLNSKQGFILVSHDRNFLDKCVDHIISINKADIDVQKGNFSSWYHNKTLQDEFEIAQNKKLKGEVKRLEEATRQKAEWSDKVERTKKGVRVAGLRPDRGHIGHKAEKMMRRSKNLERRQQKAIDDKSRLLKNIETQDSLKLYPLEYQTNRLVLFDDVSVRYGGKTVSKDISFKICEGDRISLNGANGSGKSSIIKLITGEQIDYSGNIYIGSKLKISYVSQDTSHLRGSLNEFAKQYELDESLFKAVLRKLDFDRIQFDKSIDDFSGGQKKKVLIAKSLCERAHLYLWDEPLNFIDIFSRIQIEELLLEFKPTILFVEHDKQFTDRISTEHVFI